MGVIKSLEHLVFTSPVQGSFHSFAYVSNLQIGRLTKASSGQGRSKSRFCPEIVLIKQIKEFYKNLTVDPSQSSREMNDCVIFDS